MGEVKSSSKKGNPPLYNYDLRQLCKILMNLFRILFTSEREEERGEADVVQGGEATRGDEEGGRRRRRRGGEEGRRRWREGGKGGGGATSTAGGGRDASIHAL